MVLNFADRPLDEIGLIECDREGHALRYGLPYRFEFLLYLVDDFDRVGS